VLKNVPVDDPKFRVSLGTIARQAPTFAILDPGPELAKEIPPEDRWLWLASTAYVSEDVFAWIPQFLAGLAILQPIVAQAKADDWAQALGGTPNRSPPPNRPNSFPPDEMLNIVSALYSPAGAGDSRWASADEFQEIAETWGKSDSCFGTAGPGEVTLETPFANDSALVRVRSNERHPRLGSGLLTTLQIPYFPGIDESMKIADHLNFRETLNSDIGIPLLGGWTPAYGRAPGHEGIAYSSFVPNYMYQRGIATNMALWAVSRAQWARKTLWPDAVDLPMHEIMTARLKQGGKE
jgi:hypothetical protein